MKRSLKKQEIPVSRKPEAANLLNFAIRLWRGELSFNIMVGIFFLAIPALAHVAISNLLMPLVAVRSLSSSIFFTTWICAVLIYAAIVSIGMWRTRPPARAMEKTFLPKAVAGSFFLLSLLYALYLFCSWVYLEMV